MNGNIVLAEVDFVSSWCIMETGI